MIYVDIRLARPEPYPVPNTLSMYILDLQNTQYIPVPFVNTKSALFYYYGSMIVTKLDLPLMVGPAPKPTRKRVDIVKIPNPPLGPRPFVTIA